MARRQSTSKAALARAVWQRLFDFFIGTRQQRDRILERLGLTPNDVRALHDLDRKQGRTMQSLATAWGCDASNATWIVDRLEQAGLAERRALPGDRRVKLVMLTPAGGKRRAELLRALYEPPPQLRALARADLETLERALSTLPAPAAPPWRPFENLPERAPEPEHPPKA